MRGLEALSLSVPPTPGESIVKREHNEGLFSLGEVFRGKGYDAQFLYGGYGAFDDMNCMQCEDDIEPYLDSIVAQLDIDDDTQTLALTDGMLVIRFLSEFTGTALVSGVVDTVNCNTRCGEDEIELYLGGLTAASP